MQPNHKSYNPTLIAFKPVEPYDYRLPPLLFIIVGCFKPCRTLFKCCHAFTSFTGVRESA